MTTLNRIADVTARRFTKKEIAMTSYNRTRTIVTLATVILAIFVFSITSANAVPVSATGWNTDFILGSGETHGAHDKPVNANIWFAEDSSVTPTGARPGLPASGAVTAAGIDFQFEAYTGGTDNSLRGDNTLTLVSPDMYTEISLLGSVPGSGSGDMVLNFSDGPSSSSIALSFIGWTGGGDLNPGLTDDGIAPSGGGSGFTGGMNVFTYDLEGNGLSGFTLESITFGGGGAKTIFALAGELTPPPVVPEPSTFALAALGLLGLTRLRRRRLACRRG